MKSSFSIDLLIQLLEKATFHALPPMTQSIIAQYPNDPYPVLISCLLSLRAKDTVTLPVSLHLFAIAVTPEQILALPISQIESIIRPVNYYRRKAVQLHHVSADLIARFDGKVPNNLADLLSIKGVGLKTANLVLAEAFGIPAICVDVHVHRISNRLGIIQTKTVEETEFALRQVLPEKYWIVWNRLLVMLGQTLCVAQSPWCSKCPVFAQASSGSRHDEGSNLIDIMSTGAKAVSTKFERIENVDGRCNRYICPRVDVLKFR